MFLSKTAETSLIYEILTLMICLQKAEEFGIARVPMDFTGAGGRIVNDPNEALGVAIEEVHNWRVSLPTHHN